MAKLISNGCGGVCWGEVNPGDLIPCGGNFYLVKKEDIDPDGFLKSGTLNSINTTNINIKKL